MCQEDCWSEEYVKKDGRTSEKIGVVMSLPGGLVKSRLKWEGHLERMEECRLLKRADVLKERDRKKEGCITVEVGGLCEEGHQKGGSEYWI